MITKGTARAVVTAILLFIGFTMADKESAGPRLLDPRDFDHFVTFKQGLNATINYTVYSSPKLNEFQLYRFQDNMTFLFTRNPFLRYKYELRGANKKMINVAIGHIYILMYHMRDDIYSVIIHIPSLHSRMIGQYSLSMSNGIHEWLSVRITIKAAGPRLLDPRDFDHFVTFKQGLNATINYTVYSSPKLKVFQLYRFQDNMTILFTGNPSLRYQFELLGANNKMINVAIGHIYILMYHMRDDIYSVIIYIPSLQSRMIGQYTLSMSNGIHEWLSVKITIKDPPFLLPARDLEQSFVFKEGQDVKINFIVYASPQIEEFRLHRFRDNTKFSFIKSQLDPHHFIIDENNKGIDNTESISIDVYIQLIGKSVITIRFPHLQSDKAGPYNLSISNGIIDLTMRINLKTGPRLLDPRDLDHFVTFKQGLNATINYTVYSSPKLKEFQLYRFQDKRTFLFARNPFLRCQYELLGDNKKTINVAIGYIYILVFHMRDDIYSVIIHIPSLQSRMIGQYTLSMSNGIYERLSVRITIKVISVVEQRVNKLQALLKEIENSTTVNGQESLDRDELEGIMNILEGFSKTDNENFSTELGEIILRTVSTITTCCVNTIENKSRLLNYIKRVAANIPLEKSGSFTFTSSDISMKIFEASNKRLAASYVIISDLIDSQRNDLVVATSARHPKSMCDVHSDRTIIDIPMHSIRESLSAAEKSGVDRMIVTMYRDASLFGQNADITDGHIHDKVVTIDVPGVKVNNLSEIVQIAFRPHVDNMIPTCVFSNSDNNNNGDISKWEGNGCTVEETGTHCVKCGCNHLASFALVMSPNQQRARDHEKSLGVMSIVGCTISIVSLLATLLTYGIFATLL